MKFFVVLIIIVLISPLYAQSEEKDIEKRGIYGLGGAYGLSSISYRVPVVHTLPIISGYRGYGLGSYGYGLGYGGYGNYFGW
ncbi:glycine-rich protein-like [Frieseomelitta varia]|uniref:glycine-rich protein-like n=1 Tax=Frieseomelitta varia TaxID=561572 RepID=UPI001CB69B99|nr:glycine-rich protein-like [Frieseomelitta varia]